jgi:hypothetical protein
MIHRCRERKRATNLSPTQQQEILDFLRSL